MLLRKSAPSAWDNYPRRMGSVCSVDSVWDKAPTPHGISANWLARPSVRAHSWLKKNTSRYAQIRGDFSVFSVDCFPLTSSDSDFLQFCVKKSLTQRRKGTQSVMSFCSCVKNRCTQKSQKYTETLLRMLLRKSAPSAWDNYPRRMGSVCSVDSVWDKAPTPHGISANWLARPSVRAHSWLKKNTSRYAQIRGDFSVFSVDCFPLTSSDSDFQFRVRPLPTPQGIMSFLCVISSAPRTHEPCVPTGQVISRMLMRRHNMTSLRSLYVPHGSLLPTTYYSVSPRMDYSLLLPTYSLVSVPHGLLTTHS